MSKDTWAGVPKGHPPEKRMAMVFDPGKGYELIAELHEVWGLPSVEDTMKVLRERLLLSIESTIEIRNHRVRKAFAAESARKRAQQDETRRLRLVRESN